jgi:hypothetical protein
MVLNVYPDSSEVVYMRFVVSLILVVLLGGDGILVITLGDDAERMLGDDAERMTRRGATRSLGACRFPLECDRSSGLTDGLRSDER